MRQKICALAMTAAITIGLFTTPALAAEVSFSDTSAHWAREAISQVVEKGLFQGTSADTFSPNVSMNRGMFVTVLGRFAESLGYTISGKATFTDVPSDAYYAPYVAWAADNGIVQGVGDGLFAPNDDVTREQMCALFVRFLTFIGYPLPQGGELDFVDADSIHSYAAEAVKIAVALGLIQGSQTEAGMVFRPSASATRAEVATVFLRQDGLAGIHDLNPVSPVDPVTPENPENPVDPADPDISGGGGGGGGVVTPDNPTPPQPELTQEEKDKEAEIVGYLRTMLEKYDNMVSDSTSYLYGTDRSVQDCAKTLMNCLRSALNDKDKNKDLYLTKYYVRTTYDTQIANVKQQYKALTDEQKTQFKYVAIRLEKATHLEAVLSYFGVSM